MRARQSAHLYIRVDRPLRADLLAAAQAAGVNTSVLARGLLRAALDGPRPVAALPSADRRIA